MQKSFIRHASRAALALLTLVAATVLSAAAWAQVNAPAPGQSPYAQRPAGPALVPGKGLTVTPGAGTGAPPGQGYTIVPGEGLAISPQVGPGVAPAPNAAAPVPAVPPPAAE